MRMTPLALFVPLAVLLGCGDTPAAPDAASSPDAWSAPDAPATLVGDWAQPAPFVAVLRFDADGTQRVASTRAELGSAPFATGTWELSGRRLTFTNTVGACSDSPANQVGVYDVDVSANELTFTLVEDVCPMRNVIAGETWTRLP